MNNDAIEYYKSIASEMEVFCKPLNDYFGISLFIFFKVYKDNSYISLSNDLEATKEYYSKINNDEIYISRFIGNKKRSDILLWPNNPINEGMELYFKKYWHGLSIITHESSTCLELCCFLSNKENSNMNKFYIRHNDVLVHFSKKFKLQHTGLINNSLQYRAKYKSGFNFYWPLYKDNNIEMSKFIKTSGISNGIVTCEGKFIYLTSREKQCLELLDKGFSLKGISNKLFIAPKTAQVHLTNIKNKTGYHSKSELVQIYRNSFIEGP